MKKKVLVVEDDRAVRTLNGFSLMKAGYEAVMVQDFATALLRARNDNFDLMLLDIELPSGHGNHLVSEMRRQGMNPPPIILVSGKEENYIIEKMEQTGALGYIRKPYKASELISKVNDILGTVLDTVSK